MNLRHSNKAIGQILEKLSTDEVRNIVYQYADKDKDFLFHFLCTHVRFLDNNEDEDVYEYLFYKILQHYVPGNKRALVKKAKTVIRLYQILLLHAHDMFAMEHYRTCFYVLRPGIVFLKLLSKRSRDFKELQEIYLQYHISLGQLINATIPPPLREEIQAFCVEQSFMPDYIPNSRNYNLFSFAIRLISSKKEFEEYVEELFRTLSGQAPLETMRQQAATIALEGALNKGYTTLASRMIQNSMLTVAEIRNALEIHLNDHYSKSVIEIGLSALKRVRGKSRQTIVMSLLDAAIDKKDYDSYKAILNATTNFPRYIEFLVAIYKRYDLNKKQLTFLRGQIKKAPLSTTVHEEILAAYLRSNLKNMLELLNSLENLSSIVRYVSYFDDSNIDKFEDLLFSKMADLAQERFGPSVVREMDIIFKALRKADLYDMEIRLKEKLIEKFPDRISLTRNLV